MHDRMAAQDSLGQTETEFGEIGYLGRHVGVHDFRGTGHVRQLASQAGKEHATQGVTSLRMSGASAPMMMRTSNRHR